MRRGWSIEDTAWYFQDGFWQDETTIPTRTVKMMIEVEGAPVQPYLIKNTGQTSYTTVGDTLDSTRIKVAQAFHHRRQHIWLHAGLHRLRFLSHP